MIDAETLRAMLNYDPDSGVFTWKVNRRRKAMAGARAGYTSRDGYIYIKIFNRKYLAHRLAWLYVYGSFPKQMIDHWDRNPLNNSLINLRLATNTQNTINCKVHRDNKWGYKGVYFRRSSGRFLAQIGVSGRQVYIGSYSTPEEAGAAYLVKAREIYGDYATDGRQGDAP